jgi:FkbM family methyltransferase
MLLTWRGLSLAARGMDWPALGEVLIANEYCALTPLLRETPEPVVLDLGANIGTFSIFAFSVAPRAIVHSYEPSTGTYELLAASAALNPSYKWTTVQAAAWKADETVSFANADLSTSSRLSAGGDERVPGLSLATILERCGGRADIAKIDIEGAEEAVVADARRGVLERIRTLVVELHPGRCDTDRVAKTVTASYGTVYVIPGRQSSKPLLLATRSSVAMGLPVYGPCQVRDPGEAWRGGAPTGGSLMPRGHRLVQIEPARARTYG